MILYLRLADQIGTLAARDLAAELAAWHDAMVKHARVVGARRTAKCGDDCPHVDAPMLWAAARETFGELAAGLAFLRLHGQTAPAPAPDGTTLPEIRP